MLRKILLVLGVLIVLGAVLLGLLGWWAYRVMTGPIYVPGALSAAPRLDPPARQAPGAWTVEPGVELHHFTVGSGRPVLFVHGGPGFPTREPMPWLAELASSCSVHFYDQRGCGDSTRPFDRFESPSFYANMKLLESTLGLGAQIKDIERIRRILGEERLLLVGHSFGAFIAALYAAEFPDRVEKLVLLAPADMLVMPRRDGGLFALVGERLPSPRRAAFAACLERYLDFGSIFEQDEQALARRGVELGGFILEGMGRDPADLPGAAEGGGWMVYAMYFSMGKRHDYSEALGRVGAPTLVVHAEGDLQSVGVSRQYVDRIPDATLLSVAGADHFFDGDQAELRARVAGFLGLAAE